MSQVVADFGLLAKATSEEQSFRAGEAIFREGDRAADMYVVKTGSVDIRRGNRTLETVEPGGIFGEMALVDGAVRSADAIAHSDTTISAVGEKQFLFMVSQTPYFALGVMGVMSRRLRAANEMSA